MSHPVPPYTPPQRVVPTSGLAAAGLLFALLGVAPLALGLSWAAMKKTRTGELDGHGLAVAGAILGALGCAALVFVLFIVLFSAAGISTIVGPGPFGLLGD